MTGIYKITNLQNGNFYIGLSCDIERRFAEHKTPKQRKKNTTIAKAFKKYGIETFSFEVVEECPVEILFEREAYYINLLHPAYNMNEGGKGNTLPLSEETKFSIAKKNRQTWEAKTEEEKRLIINRLTGPKKGHVVSSKTRQKITVKLTGLKQSQRTKDKRSKSNSIALIGNKNGNKPVIQSLNGNKIETFLSVKDAADSIKIHASNITCVLKGRQKTAGGYNWNYSII